MEPKSKPAEERETYSVSNNSYHIFKVAREDTRLTIDFFWGKTDFRQKLVKTDNRWQPTELLIFKKGRYLKYHSVAEHGVVFDDFRWVDENDEELFIELPKKFPLAVAEVCSSAIANRGW